jgi:AmmeMemoRadiSam system protein A
MNDYTKEEKLLLLSTADDAVRFGLENHQVLQIKLEDYPKKLRGCIGTLEAYQPLIQDVARNAYAAAFHDPRFYPLTPEEYPKITKHISILSRPEIMSFVSEQDLLQKIRPGIDGLILSDYNHCGTFLPAVWESLPTPELFLQSLKLKAGLPEDYWSSTIKIERYTSEVIE